MYACTFAANTESQDVTIDDNGSLSFVSGDVAGDVDCVSLTIIEDNILEDNETYRFSIAVDESHSNIVIVAGESVDLTIIDNDSKRTLLCILFSISLFVQLPHGDLQ